MFIKSVRRPTNNLVGETWITMESTGYKDLRKGGEMEGVGSLKGEGMKTVDGRVAYLVERRRRR